VALIINQTSVVNGESLLDTLLKQHINIVTVFVPEHGFRGNADAGAHVNNDTDAKTGLPLVSLYGNNKKPRASQLQNVDVVIYDLQDVGARFYTYISTLQYAMEACAENGKQLIVLDRPDPNGHYVDGPVLDTTQRSFVGMQPIPVVYGMTCGEYAQMLKGEQWFHAAVALKMNVIACTNYTHRSHYTLPIAPSPNLKTMTAIALYPSLCFFEGTAVSLGRGTDKPFQQWGHPAFKGKTNYSFTPASQTGASKPPLEGQECFGVLESNDPAYTTDHISLEPLIKAYQWFPDKSKFFTPFFEKLAGTTELRKQIEAGKTEKEIRAGWQPALKVFKAVRKKYLLYEDF
jgi:uncharacterized protein YbbC (DUF1343 family)